MGRLEGAQIPAWVASVRTAYVQQAFRCRRLLEVAFADFVGSSVMWKMVAENSRARLKTRQRQ